MEKVTRTFLGICFWASIPFKWYQNTSVCSTVSVCCVGELVMLGIISNQSTSKTACPLCENFGELATVMHNLYSKILLMARYTEILANLGP